MSKKTCKICIFTSVHRPYDVRVFHREARTLAEAGYTVVLIVHAEWSQKVKNGVYLKGIKIPDNRIKRLFGIFKFLSACLKEKADIYHFHDLELLPIGLFLKHLTRRPVIYDCHENYPEAAYERTWYPDLFKPVLSRLIAKIEPLLAKRLDWVVCVVPDQQERFQNKGCRTTLIRNLPRLDVFEGIYEKHLSRENRIIYLGGLTIVRGAMMLIDIVAQLKTTYPHIRLLCLGPFNEPYIEKKVKDYAKKRGVLENIDHINMVPHDQVPEYLARSRIGLIPWQPNQQTLRMVFPNKVFEYMACGLPVVSSDLPSLRYIFKRSKSGILVDPVDADAHARAIRSLLDNSAMATTLGQNGRKFVFEQYNWNIEARKLTDLYLNILE